MTLDEIEQQFKKIQAQASNIAGQVNSLAKKKDISASDMKNVPNPVIPKTLPENTSAFASINNVGTSAGLLNQVSEQLKQLAEERKRLTAENDKWYKKLAGDKQQSQAEILKEEFGNWGIPKIFNQLQSITQQTLPIQQQLANLDTQQTNELGNISKQTIPQGLIKQQQQAAIIKYNKLKAPLVAQLHAYAAQAQALQGNLTTARQFATMAANAAIYDQEHEYNRIKDFISMNQSFINRLDSDQKYVLSQALRVRENELNRTKQEKQYVADLMIKAPGAGITINDTPEEAAQKAAEWENKQPANGSASDWKVYKDVNGNFWRISPSTGMAMPIQMGTPQNQSIAPDIISKLKNGETKEQIVKEYGEDYKPTIDQIIPDHIADLLRRDPEHKAYYIKDDGVYFKKKGLLGLDFLSKDVPIYKFPAVAGGSAGAQTSNTGVALPPELTPTPNSVSTINWEDISPNQ